MGQAKVEIHQGILAGSSTRKNREQPWKEPTVDRNQAGSLTAEKKCLRSGEGSRTFVESRTKRKRTTFKRGTKVDAVMLNYCAAPG
jgi:hypothetical protein